ncbi:MAG TPA: hypothetical protein DCK95_08895 [Anaerolineaceae bacterium]|nr:hypothetical protein [Anaerolineaceae bacterium]
MYLCDYAYKDVAGKTSIIGMFTDINVLQFPSKYQQIFTILEVEKAADEQFKLEVAISSPSEQEITQKVGREIGVQSPSHKIIKMTMIYAFYGIELAEPGEYHVLLFLNNDCIHSIPFRVHQLKVKKKEE